MADAYHHRAGRRILEGHGAEALNDFEKAAAICKATEDDKDDRFKVLLAAIYADRAGVPPSRRAGARQGGHRGRFRPYRECRSRLRRREVYRDTLAGVHYHRAPVDGAVDWAATMKDFDAAARGGIGCIRTSPKCRATRGGPPKAFLYLGRMHYADDWLPEAEAVLRRADDLYGGLADKWEKEPEYRDGRDSSHYLALVLRKEMKFDEAAKLLDGLTAATPRNADYQMEFGEITLGGPPDRPWPYRCLVYMPPVGLTVVPNPLGMGQGYVGQQLSAKAEAATALDRYRLSLERLHLAEEYGRTTLSPDQRLTLARRRFAAAQGLTPVAAWMGDAESMAAAGETVAELAEAWPSLNAPNDAGRNYRLAAKYLGFAAGAARTDAGAAAYGSRMMQLLHKAVDKGYRNAAELRASPEVLGLLKIPFSLPQRTAGRPKEAPGRTWSTGRTACVDG